MNRLAEIQAAAEALAPEEKAELIRFLEADLQGNGRPSRQARLVEGPGATLLLEAPPDAPPMTTETVKTLLEDFP